jgi:FkbM family methyltransferase
MSDAFVSFAQNFEDVVLWRALGHVAHGFYIDVGAYSPDEHSVTRAFYQRDWRGLNLEPNPTLHSKFVAARPRDVNLMLAVADKPGTLLMNFVGETGLSTLDEGQAKEALRQGWTVVQQEVQADTLASVWAQYVDRDQEVHFLKVDVEGSEREVLLGNDWVANRPWIIVVEARRPLTQEPSHAAWEYILTDAKYTFAYADGLNRFYAANEHVELCTAFTYPPNVFDGFVLSAVVQASERAARAEAALAAIEASRSWRLTRPLRRAMAWQRRLLGAVHDGRRPAR